MAAPLIPANSPLLNPNSVLSGNALLQAAKGLAASQVDPAIQQLAAEISQQNSQTNNALNLTGGYFNQLGQQAQQGLTAEQSIYGNLGTQLGQIQSNENSQLGQIGQNATSSFMSHIPGGDASLAQPGLQALTSEIARQQGLAAQQQGTMKSYAAQSGANSQGLAASNLGSFAMAGQQDLNNVTNAGAKAIEPLTSKLSAENADYGSDLATALGKLRQQEITNQISDAGLGIKQQVANNTVADNIRTTGTSAANNQRTTATSAANNQRTTATSTANNERTTSTSAANNAANNAQKQIQLNLEYGSGSSKPLTTNENNTALTQLGEVQSAIKAWQQTGMKNSSGQVTVAHPTDAQMRQVLGGKYSPVLVQAAFELLGWGHITPSTAAEMHQAGIRGGSYNSAPIRVAPAPAPPTGPLTTSVQNIGNNILGAIGGFGG
jgi:hypothetical protein